MMTYSQVTFSRDGVEVILTYNQKELIVEAINYHGSSISIGVEIEGYIYPCIDMQWKGLVSKEAASNIGILFNNNLKYFNLT